MYTNQHSTGPMGPKRATLSEPIPVELAVTSLAASQATPEHT